MMIPDITPATVASFLGMTAGTLGVIAAVYLQLVSRYIYPPKYIACFLFLGSALILANFTLVPGDVVAYSEWFPAVGNLALLAFELFVIRRVHSEREGCEEESMVVVEDVRVQ